VSDDAQKLAKAYAIQAKLCAEMDDWKDIAQRKAFALEQAKAYERHTAEKLIRLRKAVQRFLDYHRTGVYERDDDSLLSLLQEMEDACA
jgi:hypothetical protein